mmetsp:Transcript_37709/g.67340  ORF Transcript_37709/g.67340 Transcript_37709/m.67340 type:complete len:227 (+) Transcript_37709:808-1488(+)
MLALDLFPERPVIFKMAPTGLPIVRPLLLATLLVDGPLSFQKSLFLQTLLLKCLTDPLVHLVVVLKDVVQSCCSFGPSLGPFHLMLQHLHPIAPEQCVLLGRSQTRTGLQNPLRLDIRLRQGALIDVPSASVDLPLWRRYEVSAASRVGATSLPLAYQVPFVHRHALEEKTLFSSLAFISAWGAAFSRPLSTCMVELLEAALLHNLLLHCIFLLLLMKLFDNLCLV